MIAVGRLLLASLFLLAILLDASQPARAVVATYALLAGYVAFALITVVATWRDWWLEARLAGPVHAIDIVFFTMLVLLTEGYTSPFFTFFMFVLLAAAIRWGWRVTTLTAILLTLLYLVAGLVVARSVADIELQRFAVRTGHLVILSLILIWFGASQWRSRSYARDEELLGHPTLGESPLESGLRAAMTGVRASSGVFMWREQRQGEFAGVAIRGDDSAGMSLPARALTEALATPAFLYDFANDRSLRRDGQRNLGGLAATDLLAPHIATRLGLSEGLAITIRSGEGEGEMFLEQVRGLSTDHIDLGEQIAADIAAHIQRHALLKAAEENAEARSRLTLARDLHDGVVQFLAGAAFRLEAIKRSEGSGDEVADGLDELKQLMLQEQRELRTFITALRSGPLIAWSDLAGDLRALADRLSRQWSIRCEFSANAADMNVPTRLHLDAHQLMREAVANAVRHAEAKSVSVALDAEDGSLRLEIINDGTAFKLRGKRPEMPASLQERVENARGELDVARGMGVTRVTIALPIGGPRQ